MSSRLPQGGYPSISKLIPFVHSLRITSQVDVPVYQRRKDAIYEHACKCGEIYSS
jgi:hypothetical protein